MSPNIRNVAIIAHVDHGKTTLVDGLLWQSGTFRSNQSVAERAMDSGDLEKERGITLTAKNASIEYKGVRINLVDTPGHADFGGEVERGLQMVDGVLLLVDAAEGPLPPTRFVLKHALQQHLYVVVVINKIDRADARPKEILDQIYQLFFDLDAKDHQIDFPIIYTDARKRIALSSPDESTEGKDLTLLFDAIIKHIPGPKVNTSGPARMLISDTSYGNYVARLAIGKMHGGVLRVGDRVRLFNDEGTNPEAKITALMVYRGMEMVPTDKLEAGNIGIVAGIEELKIGDSLCDPVDSKPLPRLHVEQPTISIEFLVNTSPFSGRDGDKVTSRTLLDRLQKELRTNVSLQVEASGTENSFTIKGRGELQFAVLAEQMRREGYELAMGRPRVITREVNGKVEEPFERVVMDVPESCIGVITEKLGQRKGEMVHMERMGEDRVRMEFEIPSRGMIGYRSTFLNDTRGTGILSSYVLEYRPWRGHMLDRQNGAMVADRSGMTTPYALFNLEPRGRLLVQAGVEVYEGMIIGEHNKTNDVNVNCNREKKLTNIRAAGSDENVILTPVQPLVLEKCIAWISDDELIEVTPNNIRLRKRVLDQNKRSIVRTEREDDE